MANRLSSSAAQLGSISEVIEGTTPATPAFQLMRITGETLEAVRTFTKSAELNPTRNIQDSQIASADAKGSIDFEFSYGSFDAFLANAMWSTWTADVLKNGVTPNPLSLEVLYNGAVATDAVYKRFTGCYLNSFELNIKMGEAIKGKADIMGRNSQYDIVPITGATYLAASNTPMLMGSDFGSLVIGGLTIDCLSMLSLKINNTLRAQRCLGTIHPTGIGYGEFEATGSGEMYLTSAQYAFIQSYMNAADVSMLWRLGKVVGNRYDFAVSRVRIENVKTEAAGQNNDILLKFDWRGLDDNAVAAATLSITRAI
jgi:hypothetical protein